MSAHPTDDSMEGIYTAFRETIAQLGLTPDVIEHLAEDFRTRVELGAVADFASIFTPQAER